VVDIDPYQCDQVHTKLLIEYLTLAVLDEFLDSKGPLFQAKLANLKKDADKKASKKTGDKGTAKDGEGESSDAENGAKKKTTSFGKKKRAVSSDSDSGTSASSGASSFDKKASKKKKKSRATRPKKKATPAAESGAST